MEEETNTSDNEKRRTETEHQKLPDYGDCYENWLKDKKVQESERRKKLKEVQERKKKEKRNVNGNGMTYEQENQQACEFWLNHKKKQQELERRREIQKTEERKNTRNRIWRV